jgi:predicted SAM-dependent methyltransferase
VLKDILFEAGKALLTRPNRPPSGGLEALRLHLGCGKNILSTWTNVDIDGPAEVVKLDLTQPLPFATESAEFIYSEHFIEHIERSQAQALLLECARILRPRGVLRLSTPSLEKVIEEYLKGRTEEWLDVEWHPRSPCQMVNEALRLWGHCFLYDKREVTALLNESGFTHIELVPWRQSKFPELKSLECRPFHNEIIVEATK